MMCSREVNTTLANRDHSLLTNCLADHGECLLPDFAIRNDVVRTIEVQLVYFFSRHEPIDFDRPPALYSNGFQLFRVELEVLALADLVAFDDVRGFDFIAGVRIHLAILDAMTGVLVKLMEADLFALAGRRIQRDRA